MLNIVKKPERYSRPIVCDVENKTSLLCSKNGFCLMCFKLLL